ncbi:restriction endonuclease subunit S [Sinorhizobium meliloti]|uniref:restriction endonuclease subunit S n=2 Tax=Rhizobium meliloti TaxID=382 RepID=UPI00398D606B
MSAQISSMLIRGRAGLAVNKPAEPVPPGWLWVPVNSVARQETGHTPSRSHPEWWGGDIPWIGIRDARLHHGGVIYDTLQTTNPLGLANSSARLLPKGTVCLSRTASVGYVTIMGRDMATSQDFVTWTCSEALVPEFLVKALIAEGEGLRKFGKGTTHTTIYFPEIRALHICLPPLAEQKRIVAKLDALSAKSARARTELARIETLVSRYKQAVLSKAFSGELTREWRHGRDWPASVRLGDVAGSFAYGSAAKSQKSGSIPVLRMGNIQNGKLDWTDLVYTDDKDEIEKYRLVLGDVLFNRTNSPPLVGKTALYNGEREAIFAGYLIRIVAGPDLDARYLTYALNSPSGREFSWNAKTDGVSQSNISASKLKEFAFAVPQLEEQHEIVRRIESAFARIDRLAKEAKRALELVGRLDEAILAKAFRGELVPQDEKDEPAELLLARIRAERETAPNAKRGRGRR